MIDWSTPQPTYEALHAELDALRTERNSAVAEAKLWLRKYQAMQRECEQLRADYAACDKSHSEWEQAYADLLRQMRRLEVEANHIRWDYETTDKLVDFLIAARQMVVSQSGL